MAILARLFRDAAISQTPQTDEERASRLAIAAQDAEHERAEKKAAADHRRRVELISLGAVLVVAAVICPVCLYILARESVPPERKLWAAPLLTLIVGGLLGYLTGRVPNRPGEK